jgi:serine/threonine-protein kinase 24/25/MST4
MGSSLEDFVNNFKVLDRDKLKYSENRIICLNSKYDDSRYVLKFSKVDDDAIESYVENFNKLKGLSHPNLITHHSIAILDGSHFKYNIAEILEQANYGTLIDYLKSNIKYSQVLKAFIQAFKGLNFLHQNGILHRDIKPTNIFVNELDGVYEIKIGDIEFWSRSIEKDSRSTPEYLAPEADSYYDYNVKSEFWAIGVMLYELFTGNYPFGSRLEGLSVAEIRSNSKKIELKELAKLPPPFNEIVSLCLQKNADHRPESMQHLLEILEQVKVE